MSNDVIAVIAAHPDDEVLGFGGAIARHAEEGEPVHVLILATGIGARAAGAAGAEDGEDGNGDAIEELRARGRDAATILGVSDIGFADFPDNRMDSVPLLDVVKRVESFLDECRATIVYGHHSGDLNIDHQIAARAVLTACRPLPGARVRRLLAGEVLSSSEYAGPADRFQPTTYVDISATLSRKCDALRCYEGEIRDWPHPRSVEAVEALARLRGSECGREAAEAFALLREIDV